MFYLRDFKNFAQAELDLNSPVTMLIGPNGSGKSNIIEAVELLAFLADGGALHEITDIGRGGKLEIRGGLDACARRGTEEFTLGMKFAASSIKRWGEPTHKLDAFAYEVTIRSGGEPAVVSEHLLRGKKDVPVFEILRGKSDAVGSNRVRYDNNSKGGKKPIEEIPSNKSALAQYARFAKKNTKLADTLRFIDLIRSVFAVPAVFDPYPKLMRDHQRVSEKQLARNGYNLSSTLNSLHITVTLTPKNGPPLTLGPDSEGSTVSRILRRIKHLPDEPFVRFVFDRTKSGDVMVGFSTPEGGSPVYARVLSDGTLRALAVLTALETHGNGQRLILEEFDNGIHPSRVSILTEAIFDCSKRHNIHVIATTHNPATLNALTPEQLDSVILTVHDHETHNAKLLPLRELPGYIDFIEQGRLGDLVTQRVYEKHLVPDYEKRRAERIQKSFANLP